MSTGEPGGNPRVAVVVGALGGLGAEIAAAFARRGDAVAALDNRPASDAVQQVEELRRVGAPSAEYAELDVTDHLAVTQAFSAVAERHSRLDVMVNSVGTREVRSTLDLSPEEWSSVIAVNLTGAFACAQAAARQMVARGIGGSIVQIASAAGLIGVAERPAYCASKHGLVGLTKAMAADLAPLGVRVNVVCPGLTETPLTRDYVENPALRDRLSWSVPMGRVGQAREIAEAVVFLAGASAGFVTGAVLPVDGGFTAVKTFDPRVQDASTPARPQA